MSHFVHRLLVFRVFLLFLLVFPGSLRTANAQGIGPGNAYYLVHDFADDWQVFDEGVKTYVPYLAERHPNYSSFSLFLNLESSRHYHLLCFSKQPTYFFINASLQRQIPAGTWAVLSVDSLYRTYRTPEVFLTFYGTGSEALLPTDRRVLLGYRRTANQPPVATVGGLLLAQPRRLDDAFGNFFVLAGLLLLLGYALLYNVYPKTYTRFYSLRDLLTVNPRDPTLALSRTLDVSNVLFVLHLSLVLAYLLLLITGQNVNVFSTQALLREGQSLAAWFVLFVEASLLIFTLFMGKYLALNLLGSLYHFERVVDYHFFKIVQASSLFFAGLLAVLMALITTFPAAGQWIEGYLLAPVVLFFLGRLLLLYFSLNKLASVKNLYLFSYLCIVELIPIIVGIRFAL